MQTISYIFPVYNEAGNLGLLYETVARVIASREKDFSFEFIFVDDGSTDDSLEKLIAIQKQDKRVTVISLSRNFGQQPAVSAGLKQARGDAVITMDSDLQDPPEVSLRLIDSWREGYDVVYATQRSRQDPLWKRLTSSWFLTLMNRIADVRLVPGVTNYRLCDRKVVDELNILHEHDRFLRGLISFVGFRQTSVPFDRDERHAGKTYYSIWRLMRLAGDGIFGFSTAPLRAISTLGYLTSAFSFLGILWALYSKFVSHTAVAGWTFVAVSIFLVGGIQMIMLGVLGGYIGRIYTEAQGRPLYIVNKIYGYADAHD